MKKRNNIMITAALGVTLLFGAASCSVTKPSSKTDEGGKDLRGWVESGKEEASKATNGTDKANEKINETLQKIANSQTDSSLAGDWAIEMVLGKKAVGETSPFIKFVPDEQRIYGNNGCNTINGQFTANSDTKTVTFSNLATTMMLCGQNDITDVEIGQALGMAQKYSLEPGSNNESILKLYDGAGQEVMQLMHRDFHFLDGTWAVAAIDGEKINIEGMKIALDVDEKRMHGNTGCNIINGELETDMDAANSISFSKIAMTRMACPDSGWETRMMVALEEAVTAKKISGSEIEFIGSNGKQVMLLKKTSPIED